MHMSRLFVIPCPFSRSERLAAKTAFALRNTKFFQRKYIFTRLNYSTFKFVFSLNCTWIKKPFSLAQIQIFSLCLFSLFRPFHISYVYCILSLFFSKEHFFNLKLKTASLLIDLNCLWYLCFAVIFRFLDREFFVQQ